MKKQPTASDAIAGFIAMAIIYSAKAAYLVAIIVIALRIA